MRPIRDPQKPSRKLTEADAIIIISRLKAGELQSRIAAHFDQRRTHL